MVKVESHCRRCGKLVVRGITRHKCRKVKALDQHGIQDKLSWSKMSPDVQRISWRNHTPPSK